MKTGKLIKYFRELRNFSRQELADLTYLTDKAIGHYETEVRMPGIDKLDSIAKALDIETKKLIEFDEEMFEEVKPIKNNLGVTIIKETKNILEIKKLIEQTKEKNQKLIIILNETSELIHQIYFEFPYMRDDIYFYRKRIFDETGLYSEERIKKIKENFKVKHFEKNDKVVCVYNYDRRYSITPSVIYHVISTGFDHDYNFEKIEVITDAGMYGTYPKDWFEIVEKGNKEEEAPKAPMPFFR